MPGKNTKSIPNDNHLEFKFIHILYLVMPGDGPKKFVAGLKMPAAPLLVVSSPNFSATIVTLAEWNSFCSSNAVFTPTIPAPNTPTRRLPILTNPTKSKQLVVFIY